MQDVTAARQSWVRGCHGQVTGTPASVGFGSPARFQQRPETGHPGPKVKPTTVGTDAAASAVNDCVSGAQPQVCKVMLTHICKLC